MASAYTWPPNMAAKEIMLTWFFVKQKLHDFSVSRWLFITFQKLSKKKALPSVISSHCIEFGPPNMAANDFISVRQMLDPVFILRSVVQPDQLGEQNRNNRADPSLSKQALHYISYWNHHWCQLESLKQSTWNIGISAIAIKVLNTLVFNKDF